MPNRPDHPCSHPGCHAAYFVADYLNIEPSTAYKRKSRVLERLTVLLFGKE